MKFTLHSLTGAKEILNCIYRGLIEIGPKKWLEQAAFILCIQRNNKFLKNGDDKETWVWVLIGEESKPKAGLGWSVKVLRFLYTGFLALDSLSGNKDVLLSPDSGSGNFHIRNLFPAFKETERSIRIFVLDWPLLSNFKSNNGYALRHILGQPPLGPKSMVKDTDE